MAWGSQWATIRTTDTPPFQLFQWSNWFVLRMPRTEPYSAYQSNRTESVLVVTDDVTTKPGGSQFSGLSPLLRVRSGDAESVMPVLDLPTDTTTSISITTDVDYEHEHESESFDRQQSNSEREADTRPSRRHRITRVPSVDDRSAVAFQNLLSDQDQEEREFLLLVAAIADDEHCYQ